MGLLRTDYQTRNNRFSCADGETHETRAKTLELISLRRGLEAALLALWKKKEQSVPLQYVQRILMRGFDTAKASCETAQGGHFL
jgi:hypothetical protein